MAEVKVELRIREIIKERGLTQQEFADQVGISRQTINNLASNPSQIRLDTIGKLLSLGYKLEDLFAIRS